MAPLCIAHDMPSAIMFRNPAAWPATSTRRSPNTKLFVSDIPKFSMQPSFDTSPRMRSPCCFSRVLDRRRVPLRPRVAVLAGVTDDLRPVFGVRPRVVAELGVDREVEPLGIEAQIGVVVFLTDDEPGDAVAKCRIQLRDDVGPRTVGGNDVPSPGRRLPPRPRRRAALSRGRRAGASRGRGTRSARGARPCSLSRRGGRRACGRCAGSVRE